MIRSAREHIWHQIITEAQKTQFSRAPDRQRVRRTNAEDAIRNHVRFRLAGWTAGGKEQIDWEKDLKSGVVAVERPLVLVPERVKQEFELLAHRRDKGDTTPIEELPEKEFPFVRKGAHAYLAPVDRLLNVRRRGFVVLAELEVNGKVHPLGYCHGLDSMPAYDKKFPNLNVDNLCYSLQEVDNLKAKRHETTAIWRTGVRERLDSKTLHDLGIDEEVSLRRIGLGSILKYIVIRQAYLRGKTKVTLNIGVLRPRGDTEMLEMPNDASKQYNLNFLKAWTWRGDAHPVEIPGEKGRMEHVANMHWMALGGKSEIALSRLTEEEGVLDRKGWVSILERIDDVAEEIKDLIIFEQNHGDHSLSGDDE